MIVDDHCHSTFLVLGPLLVTPCPFLGRAWERLEGCEHLSTPLSSLSVLQHWVKPQAHRGEQDVVLITGSGLRAIETLAGAQKEHVWGEG